MKIINDYVGHQRGVLVGDRNGISGRVVLSALTEHGSPPETVMELVAADGLTGDVGYFLIASGAAEVERLGYSTGVFLAMASDEYGIREAVASLRAMADALEKEDKNENN